MADRDWQAIAAEYISGTDSLRALAGRHAIPCSTLWDRARREGWAAHPGGLGQLDFLRLRCQHGLGRGQEYLERCANADG